HTRSKRDWSSDVCSSDLAAPMLAAGLVFVATSAVAARLNWTRLALGLWLLAVAAGGAWGGPVTTFAVCALAGGGGVLLMAVVEQIGRASCRERGAGGGRG